jgi:hypothetical protein
MKTLNLIAWISSGIGVLLMLLGVISGLMARSIVPGINHSINYFHIADSFFLITIALFLFLHLGQHKKD